MGSHIKKVIEGTTNIKLTIPGSQNSDNNGQIELVDKEIFWKKISSHVKKQDNLEDETQKAH